MWRRYYHVTHETNVASIIETGLDPQRATGAIKAVWLADSKRLIWAISHVALKQCCLPNRLWVCLVHVDPRELQRFRWDGIFLLKRPIGIYEIYPVEDILNHGPARLTSRRGK